MRKGALKVFDSTLNEWVKIPTLKGDKGDKGDPGVDADVAGCNTAIENANTATSNAIEATQDIKIVKDETQTIADYALEMGDYAKEQATTIDEKISGKADLYNYHPYEGEVKNGYWNANGDYASHSSFRAVKIACDVFVSVIVDMGSNSIANRCIFLEDSNILSNNVVVNTKQYEWIVPKNATHCLISTETANIGSILIKTAVVYKGSVLNNLGDSIKHIPTQRATTSILNSTGNYHPGACIGSIHIHNSTRYIDVNGFFNLEKSDVEYMCQRVSYLEGGNAHNNSSYFFKIESEEDSIELYQNGYTLMLNINGTETNLGNISTYYTGFAPKFYAKISYFNRLIDIYENDSILHTIQFPDGFNASFINAQVRIGCGNSHSASGAWSYLWVSDNSYSETLKKHTPCIGSVYPRSDGGGEFLTYKRLQPRFSHSNVGGFDVAIGEIVSPGELSSSNNAYCGFFPKIINGNINRVTKGRFYTKIKVISGWFKTSSGVISVAVYEENDYRGVNLNGKECGPGIYILESYINSSNTFDYYKDVHRLDSSSDFSFSIEDTSVNVAGCIATINATTVGGDRYFWKNQTGKCDKSVQYTYQEASIIGDAAVRMAGVSMHKSDGIYISTPTDINKPYLSLKWLKITP